jgi:molybdate transport system substrate-binding protein
MPDDQQRRPPSRATGEGARPHRLNRRRALAGLAATVGAGAVQAAAPAPLLIFAAASLKTALDEVMEIWRREGGGAVAASYAASSALARQLTQGAPAHLFISADLEWMDFAGSQGVVRPETRFNLAGNALVLVALKGRSKAVALTRGFDLAGALGQGRLAVAQVDGVPAGKYAKAALETLGIWATVESRLAQSENVRAALLFVARGEAPFGIVYRSDAVAEPRVEVVATFPADTHPPIVYPAALTKVAHGQTIPFLQFLQSSKAQASFRAQGFDIGA